MSTIEALLACLGQASRPTYARREAKALPAGRLKVAVLLVEVLEGMQPELLECGGRGADVIDLELEPHRLQVLLGRERVLRLHVVDAYARAVREREHLERSDGRRHRRHGRPEHTLVEG